MDIMDVTVLSFLFLACLMLSDALEGRKTDPLSTTTTCEFSRGVVTQHLFLKSEESGSITSPDWPGTYRPKTASCRVAINACENCYIDLGFETLSLVECRGGGFQNLTASELGGQCGEENGCDYLLIKDGADAAQAFTGMLTDSVYVSRSSDVTLQFCSSEVNSITGRRWKISYTVRETGVAKSCFYSINLRYTCPDGTCTDSLKDCAVKSALYQTGVSEDVPGHVMVWVIGSLLFISLVVVLGVSASGSLRRMYKYFRERYGESKYMIEASVASSAEDSDADSESSEELNSQGRDTLSPVSLGDLPEHVRVKLKSSKRLDWVKDMVHPWRHY